MPLNPPALLDLATFLIAQPIAFDDQIRFRTAINRAYYAALLTLKARIEQIQGPDVFPDAGTHSRIRRALTNTGSPPLKRLAQRLATLADVREQADYVLRIDYDVAQVEEAIDRARRLLADIATIPDDRLHNLRF